MIFGLKKQIRISFPLIQLPRKSEAGKYIFCNGGNSDVSINSTSEEVRSTGLFKVYLTFLYEFPLIQLPRKSEVHGPNRAYENCIHATVSINSTSEEVRSFVLPIGAKACSRFPLIQLPRKSEAVVL